MAARDRHVAEPDDSDDSDALSWAGDDLRGGVDPLSRNRAIEDEGLVSDSVIDPDAAAVPSSIPRTAATVLFAVLYLAIVVGWILSVQITVSSATDAFSQVAWQFGEFVSIISGALWFLATLTLTRESRTAVRVGWFALGVVVLVPWPVLLAALG